MVSGESDEAQQRLARDFDDGVKNAEQKENADIEWRTPRNRCVRWRTSKDPAEPKSKAGNAFEWIKHGLMISDFFKACRYERGPKCFWCKVKEMLWDEQGKPKPAEDSPPKTIVIRYLHDAYSSRAEQLMCFV